MDGRALTLLLRPRPPVAVQSGRRALVGVVGDHGVDGRSLADRCLASGDSRDGREHSKQGVLNDGWGRREHGVLGGDRPHRRDVQQARHGFSVDAPVLREGEVQLIEVFGASQRGPKLKPDAHLLMPVVGEGVRGPSGHIDGVARREDVAGAVDVKRGVPGKHLKALVLLRVDVRHAGEPARREDAFSREQFAVKIN